MDNISTIIFIALGIPAILFLLLFIFASCILCSKIDSNEGNNSKELSNNINDNDGGTSKND